MEIIVTFCTFIMIINDRDHANMRVSHDILAVMRNMVEEHSLLREVFIYKN